MGAFKKHYLVAVGSIFCAAIFIASAGLVLAEWQAPQLPPPQGNPAPPLDTSAVAQEKSGSLTITGNDSVFTAPSIITGLSSYKAELFDSGIMFRNNAFIRGSIFSGVDNEGNPRLFIRPSGHNTQFNFTEEYIDQAHINPIFLLGDNAGLKLDTSDNKLKFRNGDGEWTDFSINTWSKNGSSIFYNDGNVGIGVNNPDAKLSVNGNLNIVGGVVISSTTQVLGATTLATASGNVGIGTNSPSSKLDVVGTAKITGATALATVSGNVGIGTDSPRTKLDVNGPALFANNVSVATTAGGAQLHVWGADAGGGNNVLNLSRQGTTQSVTFQLFPRQQNGDEIFYLNAGTRGFMTFKNGNVGIGTTTPVYPLSASGTIAVTQGLVVGKDYVGQGFAAPNNGAIFQDKVNIGTKDTNSAGLFRVEGGDIYLANKVVNVGNQTIVKLRSYGNRNTRIEGQDITEFFDNEGGDYLINNTCQFANNGGFNDSGERSIDSDTNHNGDPFEDFTLNGIDAGTTCVDRFQDVNGVSKVNLWKAILINNENPDIRGGVAHFFDDRNGSDLALRNDRGQFKLAASWLDKDLLKISQGNNKVFYNVIGNGSNSAPLRMFYLSQDQEINQIKGNETTGGYYSYAVYAP